MGQRPLLAGGILLNQIKLCSERFGQPLVEQAITSLTEADRRELKTVLALSWVRTELSEGFIESVAAAARVDSEVLFREIVIGGVERQFRTVWRAILHFTTDNALVSRTPMIYGKTYNAGAMTSEIPEPGVARIVVTGWPMPHGRQMVGLGYGIETVLRLAGRKDVRVTHTAKSQGADFRGTWKV